MKCALRMLQCGQPVVDAPNFSIQLFDLYLGYHQKYLIRLWWFHHLQEYFMSCVKVKIDFRIYLMKILVREKQSSTIAGDVITQMILIAEKVKNCFDLQIYLIC